MRTKTKALATPSCVPRWPVASTVARGQIDRQPTGGDTIPERRRSAYPRTSKTDSIHPADHRS